MCKIKWISVNDEIPKSGKEVFATYTNPLGHVEIIIGFYAGRFEIEDIHSDEEFLTYNAENDKYYLPCGWYESQKNLDECASVFVMNGDVSHWADMTCLYDDLLAEKAK